MKYVVEIKFEDKDGNPTEWIGFVEAPDTSSAIAEAILHARSEGHDLIDVCDLYYSSVRQVMAGAD